MPCEVDPLGSTGKSESWSFSRRLFGTLPATYHAVRSGDGNQPDRPASCPRSWCQAARVPDGGATPPSRWPPRAGRLPRRRRGPVDADVAGVQVHVVAAGALVGRDEPVDPDLPDLVVVALDVDVAHVADTLTFDLEVLVRHSRAGLLSSDSCPSKQLDGFSKGE